MQVSETVENLSCPVDKRITDSNTILKTQVLSSVNFVGNANRKKNNERGFSLNIYEIYEPDHALTVLKYFFCYIMLQGLLY